MVKQDQAASAIYAHPYFLISFGLVGDLMIFDGCDKVSNNSANLGSAYEGPQGMPQASLEARSYLGGAVNF